ncbi:putative transcription factor bHLH041 isoform X1 [Coffea arabica]|uniref:Transcription factor bHLH041 isoform X1 n=1 Tax=Coffea arabica TaxID=13443 RepID=A0A6P6SXF7_COFAR
MDSVFSLGEGDRAIFLQHLVQSFGCTYICLWSYDPQPSICLRYRDGYYHERSNNQQPSTSSGSLAHRRFIEYGQSIIIVDSSHIPGLAFLNNRPYMELQLADLRRMASTETQRLFYEEAGIKTAIFMGCNAGEIELGFSDGSQVNMELEMRNLFPVDFSRPLLDPTTTRDQLPQQLSTTDQNRPASSSSSLRSLSYDSPEYSPLLFDMPATSYLVPEPQREAMIQQALGSAHRPVFSPTAASPHQQAIRALNQIRNIQLPTIESEDAAMTEAMIAVISSSASPSSSVQQPQQNFPPNYRVNGSHASAFRRYRPSLAPRLPTSSRIQGENVVKRSITFLRTLNSMRSQVQMLAGRTSSTLHHMISERRRREKLNESFQALRSLLPPGTKKDKASVLTSTREYLSSLKDQVAELSKRNHVLEAQLLPKMSAAIEETSSGVSSVERVEVQIRDVGASTSASSSSSSSSRIVDLQVILRAEVSMVDLVVRLLEFLKIDQNVSLMSVEANTRMAEPTSVSNVVLMRLRIEEGEWDESAFQEAIRRVLNDLAQ